jgi:MFS family permease
MVRDPGEWMNSTQGAMPTGAGMRRVAIASCVGTTIEFYDFFLYGTAAALVFPTVFFPALGSTAGTVASFATFAVAFIARPVGAVAFGHYGDRIGRKRTLVSTLLLMGVATVLIGLLPGAATIGVAAPILLVMLRFAQGLAVGGEWAGATLLTTEYAPQQQRGRYAMFPQLGPAIAFALASATFLIADLTLGNQSFLDYGWRIPFLSSIVLVAAGLYVRLKIEETPVFRAVQRQQPPMHTPLREVFTQAPREVLLAAGAQTVLVTLFYTGTTYLTSDGTSPTGAALSRTLVLSLGIVAGAAMALSVILSAIYSDRFGRRTMIMSACGGAVVWSLLLFPLLDTHSPVAFAIALIVTLGLQGIGYGPIGAFLPETFPTRYRYTAAGMSYNLAAIVGGGIVPLVSASLAAAFGSFTIGVLLCGLAVLSLCCTAALTETKDRDLRQAQPSVAGLR